MALTFSLYPRALFLSRGQFVPERQTRNFYPLGLKIRLTSLFFTRMVLTNSIPSASLAILGSAMAAATAAASSLSVGTSTVVYSLPPTCTARVTVLATVFASS